MLDINGKVSVIIPAFNEARLIAESLTETCRVFDGFKCAYEVIAIDDGSTDDTYAQIIRAARINSKIIPLTNRENRGKGRALKVGFRRSSGDYVVFLDADMELHPAQLATFFNIMSLTGADLVIGSKMHPNSVLNYPLQRKIVSRIYFFLIKIMFGLPINDTQTGLKLFRREVLEKVFKHITVHSFGYDLEILLNAHRKGYKIAEAPIVLDRKKYRWGRIGLASLWTTGVDTLAIWYRTYILRHYESLNYNRGKR